MKYLCAKNVDGEYQNLTRGKNLDLVIEDHNKVVIVDDEAILYVITYTNSMSEEERLVLDYHDLIKYLKSVNKNVYFFNTDKYRPVLIMREVRDKKEKEDIDFPVEEEYLYTIKDDEILRITATIPRDLLREMIKGVYKRQYANEPSTFKKVLFSELISNRELLEMYNLPLIDKYNSFMIPPYSYTHPSLFYILNGIYSKLGDQIYLSEDNLRDLYLESFSWDQDIVNKIIGSITVRIDSRYNLREFSDSIDYLENVKKQENDYTMQLNAAKKIMKRAIRNGKMVSDLGIIKEKKKPTPSAKAKQKTPSTE